MSEALINLEQAKLLQELLEKDDIDGANMLVQQATSNHQELLYDKVGHLTRQLHDALKDFNIDTRFTHLTETEIPDAKDRLNHVIKMTDEAATKTMDSVDQGIPLAQQLSEKLLAIEPTWQQLMNRQLELKKFKELCLQIDEFMLESKTDLEEIRSIFTQILMAQEFQDITGQIIGKVIHLVQEVEGNLVEMLTLFGVDTSTLDSDSKKQKEQASTKAEGPIINQQQREEQQVVGSQDDVDDLLANLGF